AENAPPDDVSRYRRAAAEQLLVSGHINEGLTLLGECMNAVGEQFPANTPGARRWLIANMVWLRIRGTRHRERLPNTGDAGDRVRLDLYRTASLGLSLVDPLRGALCQARALRTALRLGDRQRIGYALAYHAMYSAAAGDPHITYARSLVAQSRQIAEAHRSSFLLGWARASEGVVEYFAGRFELAVDVLVDAESQLRDHIAGAVPELNHLRLFVLFSLRRHGDFDRLRGHYLDYVRDAIRRGDRYALTSFRASANSVWLAADDSARAHDELAAIQWSPAAEGLHLQHWFIARARAELALYDNDPDALTRAKDSLTLFLSTPFAHVEVVRAETALELARIAIVQGDLPGAREALTRLRRERAPYLRAMTLLLEAGADALQGRDDEARAHLQEASALAEAAGMHTLCALARRRNGEILAGDLGARIIVDADAVLHRHGVTKPTSFARAFAPWPTR
ncbi:MAG: hypothetical protein JNL83_11115, partial [Myxococcales bacterium]|nr:hypothetical protein [Myxococcales bacterium]